jgi:serine beta-lactamase-like protein LACTB, mitochondrial
MSRGRIPSWVVILTLIGLLVLTIPTLWVFVSVTAPPLYPKPDNVPTVMNSPPKAEWAAVVEQARQIARASVAEQNLPGLSVAVGVAGDLVWAEGFGFADLRTSTRVRPDHRFRIGTASTVLTSAAAGLLLEKGRLKLDEEIQTYVPAFPKNQQPVTLRQLMGHTPGVKPDDGDETPLFREHCERPVDLLQHFRGNWRYFDQPGTKYRYSIYDWILVSAAIEAAAGRPFLTFIREQIFDPLRMRETAPDPGPDPAEVEGEDFPLFILIRELIHDPGATRDSAADVSEKPDYTSKPAASQVTSYTTRFARDPNYGMHVMRLVDLSCYAGSCVFLSTPSDLVRFGMAMNSGKLLKPATVELLQTPQRLASGGETGYGLGWYVRTASLRGKQTRVVGYDGDSPRGMVASLMTFPDYGIVIAVTSNISFAETSSVANKIAQVFAAQASSLAPQ